MPIEYNETTTRGMSPPLSAQTPGLDSTRDLRDMAMRKISWLRENKGYVIGICGGLALVGLGSWLVFRHKPTRMELMRDKGEELLDWMRSKF
jgi:hypothetical protein